MTSTLTTKKPSRNGHGLNTQEILTALRAKFNPPAFAMVTEVGNSTGGQCSRHADALVMSIWPSRGLELIGVEVKASRGDWLRELRNPAKAESIFKFCDRWYLAVGAKEIVQPGELPPTWGLMIPKGNFLTVAVEAPKLTQVPVTRGFLAAIFRRVHEQSADKAEIAEAIRVTREKEKECWERLRKHDIDKLAEIHKDVADFEEASGVQIRRWPNNKAIGAAVRQVLTGGPDLGYFRRAREHAMKVIEDIDALLKEGGAS